MFWDTYRWSHVEGGTLRRPAGVSLTFPELHPPVLKPGLHLQRKVSAVQIVVIHFSWSFARPVLTCLYVTPICSASFFISDGLRYFWVLKRLQRVCIWLWVKMVRTFGLGLGSSAAVRALLAVGGAFGGAGEAVKGLGSSGTELETASMWCGLLTMTSRKSSFSAQTNESAWGRLPSRLLTELQESE